MVYSKSKNYWYTAPAIRRLMHGGHKAKEAYNLNLIIDFKCGEPLNAEAVIWGEENFGFYLELVANRKGGIIANYPSMKVNPVPWENLCLG
jgi:acetyl-CoA synthetase